MPITAALLANAQFSPVWTILQRQGVDYPVTIQRLPPEGPWQDLSQDFRDEIERILSREGLPERRVPLILAMKGPEGEIEALSINFLVDEMGFIRLSCERTVKRDLGPGSAIQYAGLAFLLSRLEFMKQSGFWPESGPVLFNLNPGVSQSYRKRLGIESCETLLGLCIDWITVSEGEKFLRASPYRFEPALPPPTAATSEAVFVNRRPAR